MALPTKALLLRLDVTYRGRPFCKVEAKPLSTTRLDVTYLGRPFLAAPSPPTGFTLDVSPASLTLTSQNVDLRYVKNLSVTAGVITLTGQSVGLKTAEKLSVTSGSSTLAGQVVTLKEAKKLGVTDGAITLTGQTVTLKAAENLSVVSGSITLTGQSVTLREAKNIGVTAGVLTFTGQDLGFARFKFLQVTSASILLSGQSVTIPPKGKSIPVTPSMITYAGQSGIRGRLEFDMMVNQLDEEIEAGITMRQMLRIMAAALAGKVSGAGTGTEVFRNVSDTKNVITATVDSSGNRTAITLDGS